MTHVHRKAFVYKGSKTNLLDAVNTYRRRSYKLRRQEKYPRFRLCVDGVTAVMIAPAAKV